WVRADGSGSYGDRQDGRLRSAYDRAPARSRSPPRKAQPATWAGAGANAGTRHPGSQFARALRGRRQGPGLGGAPMCAQVRALRQGVDIVVATPGRLIDHMQRRTVDLSAIEILTLDEADRMLDMGFQPALRRIIASLPCSRQTLLFSATLSKAVVELAADFTRDPVRVDVSEGQAVATTVTHHLHTVAVVQKRAA